MAGQRKRYLSYLRLISMILVFAVVNISVAPAYTVKSGSVPSNLHPPTRIFKSITNGDLSDKAMLEMTVVGKLRQDPDILFESPALTRNLFSKLVSSKTVEVFFSATETMDFVAISEYHWGAVFMIPGFVDGIPYFTQLFRYPDGSQKSIVYSRRDFDFLCQELVSSNRADEQAVNQMRRRLHEGSIKKARNIRFVDGADEAIQAVAAFLRSAGAETILQYLRKQVKEQKVLIMTKPVLYPDTIVVTDTIDTKKRAQIILGDLLSKRGVDSRVTNEVFDEFWGLWSQRKEKEFDLDRTDPRLKLMFRDVTRRDESASNEGSITFKDEAYETILEMSGVDISDCEETVRDIKRIFSAVARHEMKDHNDAVDRGEKKKKISKEDMPGLDPEKIQVVRFLENSLLPTDVVTKDGTVRINENFVRMLYLMGIKGMKGESGKIENFPRGAEKEYLGELYSSIIYSVAIHTIRGHFPINEWGFAVFETQEFLAQGERGRKHAYVNVLAMLFYWLYCVEHCPRPDLRLQVFMAKYPEVFKGLTEEELIRLPDHLEALFWDFAVENTVGKPKKFPINVSNKPTGLTRGDIGAVMGDYPGAVSNEGADNIEEDMWADAIVDALVSGDRAQMLKKSSQKIGIALDLEEWVPDEQKILMQPLVQEIEKLEKAGVVNVTRREENESPEDFAARVISENGGDDIRAANIIVLGGIDTVSEDNKAFDPIRAKTDNDEDAAFFVGVDPKELSGNSYIRLMEMLTMAMRMSFGQTSISDHPFVKIDPKGKRMFIFTPLPPMEALSLEEIKAIYTRQLDILHAA